jgi:hypothetical protein
MFTATPSDELDQRVLVAKLRIDLVVELVVEVGEHGGVSLPPFYPRWWSAVQLPAARQITAAAPRFSAVLARCRRCYRGYTDPRIH